MSLASECRWLECNQDRLLFERYCAFHLKKMKESSNDSRRSEQLTDADIKRTVKSLKDADVPTEDRQFLEQPLPSKATNVEQRIDESIRDYKQARNQAKNSYGHHAFNIAQDAETVFKQQLLSLIEEVIGEDLPNDIYGSWTRRANGSMIPLSDEVIITNKVLNQQRAKLKGVTHE